MNNTFVRARNAIISFLYKNILKRIFFMTDPEMMHERMVANGRFLGNHGIFRKITALCFSYSHAALEQNILGIRFANPMGLAAGFDKNGQLTDILPHVGFGFEEVGSMTLEANTGNPKPRLYRLPKSNGLVVNYGLPNEGVDKILDHLAKKTFFFPVGISVAKTNSPK